MQLKKVLDKKAVEYGKFDIARMPRIYAKIKDKIKLPKIIQIIGTNGKGSTGRFLATYLYKSNFQVGHFTSPHIEKLNERFWLNGELITNKNLEEVNQKFKKILLKKYRDELSYFEYLTFLAIIYFQDVDYLILEAGLGGEFDSTSVFENILTLITPIGIDHQEFLGNSIKEIATTKLKAIQKEAIISKQKFQKVYDEAKQFRVTKAQNILNQREKKDVKQFIKKSNLPPFQKINLLLALACIKRLNISPNIKLLKNFIFKGRYERISKNILLDVGHNLLATEEIIKLYKKKKVILLYNTFFDKNFKDMLSKLKSIIEWLEIVEIKHNRVVKKRELIKTLEVLDIKYKTFKEIDKNKEYLVFGSFIVAQQFLKRFKNQKYQR